jgi:catechol 2,3-dioxygenase-like lactoylglutathione lyase family enzyme
MTDLTRPKLGTFNHASIPVRNLEEAKRFYTEVLGGEVTLLPAPGFAEVRLGGAIIGLSEQKSGWTGPANEYPHYAFTMAAEDFNPFVDHLKASGVKTGPVWTRHGVEALMYFRDPSGNLLEIYCERGLQDADKLPRSGKWGGKLAIDFADLNYEWKGSRGSEA